MKTVHKSCIYKRIPRHEITSLQEVTQGWDHDVYIINHKWVFRFPKHDKMKHKLKKETKLLNHLMNKNMGIDVPQYHLLTDDEQRPIGVTYDLIIGHPLESLNQLSRDVNHRIARQLGLFLTKLHEIDRTFVSLIGFETKYDQLFWSNLWLAIQTDIYPLLEREERQLIERLFTYFFDTLFDSCQDKHLIHGDLSTDHILFDQARQKISGIIDFTDANIGDPAHDFAGIYIAYGIDFTKKVLNYYETKGAKEDLFARVHFFYGHQYIFHQMLHVKDNLYDFRQVLKRFRSEWRHRLPHHLL